MSDESAEQRFPMTTTKLVNVKIIRYDYDITVTATVPTKYYTTYFEDQIDNIFIVNIK